MGLSFDQVEDSFPSGAMVGMDGVIQVSAQWLHDFAHAIEAVEREACAQVCDSLAERDYCVDVREAAAAIRKR